MEQSYIKKMSKNYLNSIGLTDYQIERINSFCERAINEQLYTNTLDYQHDLKHIERVMIYAQLIMNKMNSKTINEEAVLLAILYHDIGKTIGASNREHGIIGSKEFIKRMNNKINNKIDNKLLEQIFLIIQGHCEEENKINFGNTNLTKEEQEETQLMSNILKDADALDRNRLNFPPPIGTCDISFLRTEESKQLLPQTNDLLKEYWKTMVQEKEQTTKESILDNWAKLKEWINTFNSNDHSYIYHASLTPAITKILPNTSTQAGKYVYADVDPIKCSTMACFRTSLLIQRNNHKRIVTEIFPNAIESAIGNKYLTIYRLPKEKFKPYIAKETAAPGGEWISSEAVEPIEEITVPASMFFQYLVKENLMSFTQDFTEESQVSSVLKSLEMYIWGIKELPTNSQVLNNKFGMMIKTLEYYGPDLVALAYKAKEKADELIEEHIEYCKSNNITLDFNDESKHLTPILKAYRAYEQEVLENIKSSQKNNSLN